MGVARRGTPEPAGPPLDLSRYYGLWVAVLRGEVVAAAATPRELAFRMNTLPAADRRDAVVQKAHPPSGAVVVGMG